MARHLGRLLRRRSPLANFAAGIPEPSYNTWNIGIGFTYKVFTLDFRYSDTNLSKATCNAFTSDHTTTNFNPAFVTRSTRVASAPSGAAPPASSSCRLT